MKRILAIVGLLSICLVYMVSPVSAMQSDVLVVDNDTLEHDIGVMYVPNWETIVKGWDWLNRFIQLVRLAWQLQQAVQDHWIAHGQGWWTHNGEISCDIYNGIVSWR